MTPTTCGHTKASGEPCETAFGLCDQCGECFHHCVHRQNERQAAWERGGQAIAKKLRNRSLSSEDLPPLTSHEAAEIWTDEIGRAVATGRLSGSAATAALRAVKEWRESRHQVETAEVLDRLVKAVLRWKETGDEGPMVQLVKDRAS